MRVLGIALALCFLNGSYAKADAPLNVCYGMKFARLYRIVITVTSDSQYEQAELRSVRNNILIGTYFQLTEYENADTLVRWFANSDRTFNLLLPNYLQGPVATKIEMGSLRAVLNGGMPTRHVLKLDGLICE